VETIRAWSIVTYIEYWVGAAVAPAVTGTWSRRA
jgi:hypothetical protein